MTRTVVITGLFIIMILLVGHTPGLAQTPESSPLIVLADGKLWVWQAADNSLLPLITDSGYFSSPSPSPDGRLLAYNARPPVLQEYLETFGGFSGAWPDDIWLMDLATGETRPIAVQPSPAYLGVEGHPNNVLARSRVAWSPDGTQFAWNEYMLGTDTAYLVLYDLATGVQRTIFTQPPQWGIPGPPEVDWVDSGLIIYYIRYDETLGDGVAEIYRFTPGADRPAVIPLDADLLEDTSIDILARYGGRDYYAALNRTDNTWVLIDLVTGEASRTTTWPELVSTTNPDGSLRVALRGLETFRQQLGGQASRFFSAQLLAADGTPLAPPYEFGYPDFTEDYRVALAPGGEKLAYRPYNQDTRVYGNINVWDGGETALNISDDMFIQSMVWGPQTWRFPADAVLEPVAFQCPGALPTRITSPSTAVVLPGNPNRVRDIPSLSGAVLGQIPPGEEFSVVGGPVCADSIVWWQVQYGDLAGWTAEGADAYFIEMTALG